MCSAGSRSTSPTRRCSSGCRKACCRVYAAGQGQDCCLFINARLRAHPSPLCPRLTAPTRLPASRCCWRSLGCGRATGKSAPSTTGRSWTWCSRWGQPRCIAHTLLLWPNPTVHEDFGNHMACCTQTAVCKQQHSGGSIGQLALRPAQPAFPHSQASPPAAERSGRRSPEGRLVLDVVRRRPARPRRGAGRRIRPLW